MSKEFLNEGRESKLSDHVEFSVPSNGMPQAVSGPVQQLTVEQLDQMINNPNEHPEIRMKAMEMRENVFGKVEDVEDVEENVEPEPEVKKTTPKFKKKKDLKKKKSKKSDDFSDMKRAVANKSSFNNLLKSVSDELYLQEVNLLVDDVTLKLRSMTVEEYKFLSKGLESYVQFLSSSSPSKAEFQESNISFTNTLDTILSRCITDNVDINDVSFYDWFYLLMYVRCLSRGHICTFNMKRKEEERSENVEVNLYDLLDYIKEHKNDFVDIPIHIEDVNDVQIVLMHLNRGDMRFAENYCLNVDSEMSVSLANLAMSVKGFVEDSTFYTLTPEQRMSLFSGLNYDLMQNLNSVFKKSEDKFVAVINEWFDKNHPDMEALQLSDFILSFYTI
jgi:hypothetical protein